MPIEIMGIKFSKSLHYVEDELGVGTMSIKDRGSKYSTEIGQIDCESEPLISADPTKSEWRYTVRVSFDSLDSHWTLIQTLDSPEMANPDINELMRFVKQLYRKATRRELKSNSNQWAVNPNEKFTDTSRGVITYQPES